MTVSKAPSKETAKYQRNRAWGTTTSRTTTKAMQAVAHIQEREEHVASKETINQKDSSWGTITSWTKKAMPKP